MVVGGCEAMITTSQTANKVSDKTELNKQEIAWDPRYLDSQSSSDYDKAAKEIAWDPTGMTQGITNKEHQEVSESNNEEIKWVPSPKKKSRSKVSADDTAVAVAGYSSSKMDNTADNGTVVTATTADSTAAPSVVSDESRSVSVESGGDSKYDGSAVNETIVNKHKVNGKKHSSPSKKSPFKRDVPWDADDGEFDSDGEWGVEDFGKDSPSTWDPETLKNQTGELDPWKDLSPTEPDRIQDLPLPALAEPEPEQRIEQEDEWPFKSPCAFTAKRGRSRGTPTKSVHSYGSSDIDSVGSKSAGSNSKAWKKREAWKNNANSKEDKGASEAQNHEEKEPVEAWRMRESWKSSAHTNDSSERQDPSEHSNDGKQKSKKKDNEPSKPKRASTSTSRPDAEEDAADEPPAKPKNRKKDPPGQQADDDEDETFQELADKPKKPTRRSLKSEQTNTSSDSGDSEIQDELSQGSFHGLVQDCDKVRSRSKDRRSRTLRGGRRRQLRDQSLENSADGEGDDGGEDFGEDVEEVKLKDVDEAATPARRRSWRDRRGDNRTTRDRSLNGGEASADGADGERSVGSGGTPTSRRPPSSRRAMIRRAQSERWRKAVEGEEEPEPEAELAPDSVQGRARNSLMRANAELSRSAHSARRYHSGGLQVMTGGLDRRSFHNAERNTRTARKQSAESQDADSYDEYESYDVSGRSQRTLDSIEDLEDFEHIDFQTPGIQMVMDYDEEIYELMQKANPEHTAQLNRRVHRKRDQVAYDQDMPMMTRQALLTRQASSQVMRQRVDTSNLDRRRLMLRSDSMSSAHSTEQDLSLSNHRGRFTPGTRRAPPRTRSSTVGMGRTEIPSFMQQPPRAIDQDSSDDRRQLFRTRSNTTNTNSFRQYLNKPNKVAQLTRRAPGDAIEPHSMRGSTSASNNAPASAAIDPHSMRGSTSASHNVGVDKRGTLQRAHSTTGLRRPIRTDPRALTPNRDEPSRSIPKSVETKVVSPGKEDMPDLKSTSSDSDEDKAVKKAAKKDDDSIDSEDEDSSVESMEGPSPTKPSTRKTAAKPSPPVKATPSPKKTVNKRDFTVERNRRKLHQLMYEHKMGVNMKDLFKQVKTGDVIKSPKSPRKSPKASP